MGKSTINGNFNSYVSLPEGNCFITNDGGWHPHSWLHPCVWHVSCHHMARRPRRVFLCHHQARVFRRVAQDGPGGEAHGCGPHSDRCSAALFLGSGMSTPLQEAIYGIYIFFGSGSWVQRSCGQACEYYIYMHIYILYYINILYILYYINIYILYYI